MTEEMSVCIIYALKGVYVHKDQGKRILFI